MAFSDPETDLICETAHKHMHSYNTGQTYFHASKEILKATQHY